jgi:hypothetical protein
MSKRIKAINDQNFLLFKNRIKIRMCRMTKGTNKSPNGAMNRNCDGATTCAPMLNINARFNT